MALPSMHALAFMLPILAADFAPHRLILYGGLSGFHAFDKRSSDTYMDPCNCSRWSGGAVYLLHRLI